MGVVDRAFAALDRDIGHRSALRDAHAARQRGERGRRRTGSGRRRADTARGCASQAATKSVGQPVDRERCAGARGRAPPARSARRVPAPRTCRMSVAPCFGHLHRVPASRPPGRARHGASANAASAMARHDGAPQWKAIQSRGVGGRRASHTGVSASARVSSTAAVARHRAAPARASRRRRCAALRGGDIASSTARKLACASSTGSAKPGSDAHARLRSSIAHGRHGEELHAASPPPAGRSRRGAACCARGERFDHRTPQRVARARDPASPRRSARRVPRCRPSRPAT